MANTKKQKNKKTKKNKTKPFIFQLTDPTKPPLSPNKSTSESDPNPKRIQSPSIGLHGFSFRIPTFFFWQSIKER